MLSTLGLSIGNALFWGGFHLLILLLLFLDMGVFHKKNRPVSIKESLGWSIFWIGLSLLFNLVLYWTMGSEVALQFFTGYLIEKSLSVDNLFVFALIFAYFKIPLLYQHKVLYWGIFGAIVMRLALILAGTALIVKFHFLLYVFGAFILATGLRFFFQKQKELHPERNLLVKLCKRFFKVTEDFCDGRFFIRKRGILYMTPLFIAHLIIESADVVFALDSIPAILAVTQDPFIVYTSNIFAILGLRSLYFLLASSLDKFSVLKYGLALILVFIGAKMLLDDIYPISIGCSLLVVISILAVSFAVALSRDKNRRIW